jgi:hypothetical protein
MARAAGKNGLQRTFSSILLLTLCQASQAIAHGGGSMPTAVSFRQGCLNPFG